MNVSEMLIEYWNTHNTDTLGNLKEYDLESLNVIVVELLSWLKLERKRELWLEEGKRTCLRALELNMNYPWCTDLLNLLQSDTPLAEVFCIEDKHLKFRDSVSESYKHEARRIAYEQYNPQMIIG